MKQPHSLHKWTVLGSLTSKLAPMRTTSTLLALPVLSLLVGCGSGASYVKSETALGRVVIYRNGVAYFERSASVTGDSLKLAVPPDKVDDFLKSLTVTDAVTGQPAPVSYPSSSPDGTLEMKISLPGSGPHNVKLTYVTEAPAWKPSYRIVLGNSGKVNLQSWAIVDNTSGEDWDRVKLGVGSSSAMSFRFNLRGVRLVDRQTLRADDLFAQAPPTGGATYDQKQGAPGFGGARVWGDYSDDAIAKNDATVREENKKRAPQMDSAPVTIAGARPSSRSKTSGGYAASGSSAPSQPSSPPMEANFDAEQRQFQGLINGVRNSDKNIVVEGYALPSDRDKQTASLERANKVRDQLLRSGVDGTKITAIGKGEQQGKNGGVRILEVPAVPPTMNAMTQAGKDANKPEASVSGDPIGTSHFESGSTMSVLKGSSAMVSIYKGDTGGDVVYLYDAESQRGNAQYPFKAVRFKNPTDSQLEQGPVTVFGDGRFIGEGLAEPIPARGTAFVPYALDRQIVVERKDGEKDEIARIITVQRGVFSTEVKHSKKRTLTIFNRSNDSNAVYIRHTLTPGYAFTSNVPKLDEKLGGAQLFKIDVPAHGKVEAVIEEATPVYKTTDIRTTDGLEMIRVFASQAALDAGLKTQVNELIKLHLEMANLVQRIQTVREQQGEYKARMDELHAQIFTLKAVKTAGPMMNSLEKKMMEMSDRVSKATIEVVGLEEKLMVAKIKFQDGVAELSTEKTPATAAK
jgi:hypothetical protein